MKVYQVYRTHNPLNGVSGVSIPDKCFSTYELAETYLDNELGNYRHKDSREKIWFNKYSKEVWSIKEVTVIESMEAV